MKTPTQKLPEGIPQEEVQETPTQERTEIANGLEKATIPSKPNECKAMPMDMSAAKMPDSLKG